MATKTRGFAALSLEERKRIASNGGKAAHANGNCHVFTSEEARAAGAKGGAIVARDREHMSRIGRKGGRKAAASRQAKAQQKAAERTRQRATPVANADADADVNADDAQEKETEK